MKKKINPILGILYLIGIGSLMVVLWIGVIFCVVLEFLYDCWQKVKKYLTVGE